jgi:hypothetical protein
MRAMQQPSFEQSSAAAVDASPAPPGESIRYGEAIKFAFRTERPWMNILVTTVFAFVPVAGPMAIAGWHAEIMQRLARRHPVPIPTLEFSDFTHYLMRGMHPFVSRVIVALPLTFVTIFGAFVAGGVSAATARTGDPTAVLVVWAIILLAIMLVMPFVIVIGSAVYTRADLVEDIPSTLKMKELGAYMRAMWLTILGSSIVFGMISTAIVLLGFVACYFGAFVASAIIQLAQVHLRWQVYERFIARGGEPIPAKPPVWVPSELARMYPGYPPR